MDPLLLITLAGCVVCAAGGIWLGGYICAKFILGEVVEKGVLVYQGTRYRVDRIGRKPKE